MIQKLQINNFRNHLDSRLTIPDGSKIVVLYGENGSGKTNVLEAVSLLFESNGLRKAKYDEMINSTSGNSYWNIISQTEEGIFSSGYILKDSSGKRIYKVNDKNVRSLDEFRKDNYVLWMTYETDRLFLQSPSDRRDFVDMFCNVKCKEHSQNVKDYEKLARERLKILKKFCEKGITPDIAKWLDVIELKIIDLGIKIASERIKLTQELEKYQISNGEFPMFLNKMSGRFENEILNQDKEKWRSLYKAELINRRQKDGFSGSTTLGPNRSDWIVFHKKKQINAEHCSAGEQKMLLSGIFFAFVLHNLKTDNRNLIVLLDDVIAHLDSTHRDLLFKYTRLFVKENHPKVSVWLSGTSKDLFHELSEDTCFFEIRNGQTRAFQS